MCQRAADYTFLMPKHLRLFIILIVAGFLFAQADQPDTRATIQYLTDTIDWYHHLRIEEQLVTDPTDAMFLEDNRQLARQIVRLSFDFARAEAKSLSSHAVPAPTETQSPELARYSGLVKAAEAADQEVKETEAEIESLKQKLQTAQGEKRRELQSTIDEVQSELNLDRTRSETFKNILQFVGEAGAIGTNLQAQIDELARSVPEVEADTTKSPAAPAAAPASRNQQPSGILDLITNLFALNRKINALDQAIQSTDEIGRASCRERV